MIMLFLWELSPMYNRLLISSSDNEFCSFTTLSMVDSVPRKLTKTFGGPWHALASRSRSK